jgi:hypothetical protein
MTSEQRLWVFENQMLRGILDVCKQHAHPVSKKDPNTRQEFLPDIHSFTDAYSPGWTFGLPFRGFLIAHIQTHGRTPLDE